MTELNPLTIHGLGHQYGNTSTLNAINLCVRGGEFVTLLGPSGCGKTTLLKSVAGLVTPQHGSINIDGTTVLTDGIENIPCEKRGVGLVFQEYALFPHMTVAENVAYGIHAENDARVNGLLELVGLSDLSDRLPAELSGGQQQRVALARALAPRPALLLLDEPFANVDAALRESLGLLLRRVVQDQGAAVLMVTHDQQSALALADRVVIIEATKSGGEITQDATPSMVYRRPNTPSAAQLTGPCTLIEAEAEGQKARSELGELRLIEPKQGRVQIMIRPEQLQFSTDPSGTTTIEDVVFSGATHTLLCDSPIGQIEAIHLGRSDAPSKGSRGSIHVVEPVWAL